MKIEWNEEKGLQKKTQTRMMIDMKKKNKNKPQITKCKLQWKASAIEWIVWERGPKGNDNFLKMSEGNMPEL